MSRLLYCTPESEIQYMKHILQRFFLFLIISNIRHSASLLLLRLFRLKPHLARDSRDSLICTKITPSSLHPSLSLSRVICHNLCCTLAPYPPLVLSLQPQFFLDKSGIKGGGGVLETMPSSGSFLRQLSAKEAWRSTSNRWSGKNNYSSGGGITVGGCEASLNQMEGFNMYGNEDNGMMVRKRVMVVVDPTSHSKHAMMWALSHVANKGDLLTLLHIVPPHKGSESSCSTYLVNYLGSLCKDCKPELEVEALVIQGPKLATVMSQVKKLEVSVLVLGQKKPPSLFNCICGNSSGSSSEEFVEQCINNADCLTIGVRKRSQGTNGYFISTRWQKNFWLLA